MTHRKDDHTTRIVGRSLRLLLGAVLTWMTYDVMRSEDSGFNLRVVGAVVALTAFYSVVHIVVSKRTSVINPWIGAFVAVVPVVLAFVLGGPVGRVASVAYVGVSLLLQGIRSDGGCEVMSIPAMLFGQRTHLACLAFTPIDRLEEHFARGRSEENA